MMAMHEIQHDFGGAAHQQPLDSYQFSSLSSLSSSSLLPLPFLHPGLLAFIDGNKEKLGISDNELRSTVLHRTETIIDGDERHGDTSPSTFVSSSTSDRSSSSPPHRNIIVHGKGESPKKKKELVKDDAYWMRRKKNNDAAKRSRDSRRQKEDEMAARAVSLERENVRLKMEVEHLRAETDHLRTLFLPSSLLLSDASLIKTPVPIRVSPSTKKIHTPVIARGSVLVHNSAA